jgi:hypothetical protein
MKLSSVAIAAALAVCGAGELAEAQDSFGLDRAWFRPTLVSGTDAACDDFLAHGNRLVTEAKRPILLVPVAFVSEHSETLVELDIEYRKLATEHGAGIYIRVPVVGTQPAFIAGLARSVLRGRRRGALTAIRSAASAASRPCPSFWLPTRVPSHAALFLAVALHIIAFTAWMAEMLYLPRLYVPITRRRRLAQSCRRPSR